MANEYPQYGLIQQIQQGGVNIAGDLLKQYRAGVDYKEQQDAKKQSSQLKTLQIQQAQADITATNLKNDKMQLEVDQYKKSVPLLDAQNTLDLEKVAAEQQTTPLKLQYAIMKLQDQVSSFPIDSAAAGLQSFNQIITAHSASPEAYQKYMTTDEGNQLKKEFDLTGDLAKDQPMISAIKAATLQVPKLQAAMLQKQAAAENARTLLDMRLQSNERIAMLRTDALLKRATLAEESKIHNPRKDDVILARAELKADPELSGVTPDQLDALSTRMATRQLAYESASHLDAATARAMAYQDVIEDVKSIKEESGGVIDSLRNDIRGFFGLKTEGGLPAPKPLRKGPAGTQTFVVNGVTYHIPESKVAAFKKNKGIK